MGDIVIKRLSFFGYTRNENIWGNSFACVILMHGVTIADLEKHPENLIALRNTLHTTKGLIIVSKKPWDVETSTDI